MKNALPLFLLLTMTGCATGYQAKSATGGFDQTKLAENLYQVRYSGNGYESQDRVAQFLLRRAAELALENGGRWFLLSGQQAASATTGSMGMVFNFPSGIATVRLLGLTTEERDAIDAVTVVNDTATVAGGKLSNKAKWQLRVLQGEAAPLVAGTKLYELTGVPYGEVIDWVPDHRFLDGTVAEAVHVRMADGENAWVALRHVLKLRAEPPAPKE